MKNQLTFLLFLSLFLFNCQEDQINDDDNNIVIESCEISLINPIETIENPCCISFDWSQTMSDSSSIQLSINPTFDDLILDGLYAGNTLQFNEKLIPSQQYYWKACPTDSCCDSSSFEVKDIISEIEGLYNVSIKQFLSSPAPPLPGSLDTIYYESTIEIIKDDLNVRVIEPITAFDRSLFFDPSQGTSNELVYEDNWQQFQQKRQLIINTNTGTLSALKLNGGNGGTVYTIYTFID